MTNEYNATAKVPLTTEQYAELNLVNQLNARVTANLNQAAAQITEEASLRTPDQQAALIETNLAWLAANPASSNA